MRIAYHLGSAFDQAATRRISSEHGTVMPVRKGGKRFIFPLRI
jgi:hypothetical protein